jgi:hypothetical protein
MGYFQKKERIFTLRFFQKHEPVPKLIDYALTRTVLGQILAVFQAFSLAKRKVPIHQAYCPADPGLTSRRSCHCWEN